MAIDKISLDTILEDILVGSVRGKQLPAWIIEKQEEERKKREQERDDQRPRVYPPGQDPRERDDSYRKDDGKYKSIVIKL